MLNMIICIEMRFLLLTSANAVLGNSHFKFLLKMKIANLEISYKFYLVINLILGTAVDLLIC